MIANVWGSDVAINGENTDWCGSIGTLAGPIKIVRRRAKSFQETSNKYLNNINPDDLDYRLEHFKPQADWSMLNDESDDEHRQVWNEVQENSQELRNLAICGYDLYNTCFPEGTKLRSWLDALDPGYHLFFHWTRKAEESRLSVPFRLLYL